MNNGPLFTRACRRVSASKTGIATGIVIIQDGNRETVVLFLRVPVCSPSPLSPFTAQIRPRYAVVCLSDRRDSPGHLLYIEPVVLAVIIQTRRSQATHTPLFVIRLRRPRDATTAHRTIIRSRHTTYTSSGRRRSDARTPLPPVVVVVRLRGVATLRGRSTRRPVPGHVVREVQRGQSARALHAG